MVGFLCVVAFSFGFSVTSTKRELPRKSMLPNVKNYVKEFSNGYWHATKKNMVRR